MPEFARVKGRLLNFDDVTMISPVNSWRGHYGTFVVVGLRGEDSDGAIAVAKDEHPEDYEALIDLIAIAPSIRQIVDTTKARKAEAEQEEQAMLDAQQHFAETMFGSNFVIHFGPPTVD